MKTIGVVLSGCGVFDGAEIHEAVITLLALDRAGVSVLIMAPNVELEEINHITGKPTGGKRNVLLESARIARGKIKDIAEIKAANIDGLIFPGGFGAAKNLSNFAVAGANAEVHPEVERLVKEVQGAKKPIGVICIAPATLACILGKDIRPLLTIGKDPGMASAINQTGAEHREASVEDVIIDEKNKIVSTPAYMLAGSIKEAAAGIEKLVTAVVSLSY